MGCGREIKLATLYKLDTTRTRLVYTLQTREVQPKSALQPPTGKTLWRGALDYKPTWWQVAALSHTDIAQLQTR